MFKLLGSRFSIVVTPLTVAAVLLMRTAASAACAPDNSLQGCVVTGGVTPPTVAPAPGQTFGASAAGLFEYSKTDLTIAAPIPIQIVRTYRSVDKNIDQGTTIYGAFGLGTTLNYDIYLFSAGEAGQLNPGDCTNISVVLPDGGQIDCKTTSTTLCSNVTSSSTHYYCAQEPTGIWFNSQITYNASISGGGGWDLRRKDGMHYMFGKGAPLQRIQDRYGNAIALTRDGSDGSAQRGNVTKITASNGRSLTLSYAGSPGNCCISGFTDAAGRQVTYTYTTSSQLKTVYFPNMDNNAGNATVTFSWGTDHPTSITLVAVNSIKPGGTIVTHRVNPTYDYSTPIHKLTSIYPGNGTDPSIGVQYAYTVSNQQIQSFNVTFPDGSHRKFTLDAAGYIKQDVRNSSNVNNAQTFDYTRDGSEKVTLVQQEEDPLHRKTKLVYDTDGNVTSETLLDSANNPIVSNSYQYDYQFDQLKQFTNGLGNIWTVGLDTLGNPTSVTDPIQRTWCLGYTTAGLLKTITDPAVGCTGSPLETLVYTPTTLDLQSDTHRASDSETTNFGYDLVGRLKSVTSPLSEVTNYTYDDQDEVLTVTDPRRFVTTYAYDWAGHLNSLTDARTNKTTWNWSPPATEAKWDLKECDPKNNCAEWLINGVDGSVSRYIDKRGVVSNFQYDELGRLNDAQYDVNDQLGHGTYHDAFTYDRSDRLIGVKHGTSGTPCVGSDGANYADAYTYDSLDDVKTACTPEGTISNGFDAIGRRITMSAGGFPQLIYFWDDADQLTAAISGSSFETDISYFPDGQRQTLTVINSKNTVTTNYSYDPLSQRLSSIAYGSKPNPSLGNLTYQYDRDGRVIGKGGSFATVNLPAASPTASYASTNQIQTWTNGVSPNVNQNEALTSDPATGATYTYDSLDELLTAGGATYTYDAGGRRESVVSGGQTTTYLYDGAMPIVVNSGIPQTIIAMPDSNEILLSNGNVLLHEALGSVIGGVNSSGALQFQYKYGTFGSFTATGTPPSGYGNVYAMAGIEYDPTGLYHANARYYSPKLQRFLSEDPQRGKANMYGYAGNNPISGSDISGMGFTYQCVDCDLSWGQSGEGGGDSVGPNPIAGFANFLATIFTLTSSSAAPPINYLREQREHTFGLFDRRIGSRGHNVYSDDSSVVRIVGDEEEGGEGPPKWTVGGGGGGAGVGGGSGEVGVGGYAGESIPAGSAGRQFTPAERAQVNKIGSESGCHTCGTTNPGTKSGNFVPDHQPPSALNPSGEPQRLYPHCVNCSRQQGLGIIRQLRQGRP